MRTGIGVGVAAVLTLAPGIAVADDVDQGSLLLHSDFEDTTDPWQARGNATLELTDQSAREGDSSLLVTGRTEDWQGAAIDALDLFEPGQTYTIEAWVSLPAGDDGADLSTEIAITVEEQNGETEWVRVAQVQAGSGEWAQLSGTYTAPAGLSAASLYFEAAPIDGAHPDFLIDEVGIFGAQGSGAPPADLGLHNDFEDTLGAWGPRGSDDAPSVELSDAAARSGAQSALISEREQNWHGISADITEVFDYGEEYAIDLWVRMAEGEDPADVRVSVQRDVDGESTYETVVTATGVGADWVNITGAYMMGNADTASLYIETAEGTSSFHVDDIAVGPATPGDPDLGLQSMHDAVDWPLGVAIDARETVGASSDLVLHHYNQITAENHMKPDFIQPEEGVFTFDEADALIEFAVENDLDVYGHTLVWHSQTPDWFFQDAEGNPLTDSPEHQELLRMRMRVHIETTANHFRAKFGEFGTSGNPIVAYDVVNEAIADNEDDGLRRSPWYNVLGEQFLDDAFHFASQSFNNGQTENPPVTLFLNDYNTELPPKRAAMVEVVQRLQDRGVPISGVGHQFHVSLEQPLSQLEASLEAFSVLNLPQAVTELDVGITGAATDARLVQQGYYYADLFQLFADYDLFSVTIWGPYDTRSWRAEGSPLPFDGDLQAKPAYWGIVDPEELPVPTTIINAHHAEVDGLDDLEWDLLPEHEIGTEHGFSVRWSEDHLNVLVRVTDEDAGSNGLVSIFTADEQVDVPLTGDGGAAVTGTDDGYLVFAQVPAAGLAEGDQVDFDVRVTAGEQQTSWNDFTHNQEDGERLGVLSLVDPVSFVQIPRADRAPQIDGELDEIWAEASEVLTTQVQVEENGSGPHAQAEVRLLWHGEQVFMLLEVTDAALDKTNSNAWEQDSVEIFLDPVNAKSGAYNPEDGQYRINFDNEHSIGGETELLERLTSATTVTEDGYLVEAVIDLGHAPEAGALVGLEFQVNDATAGERTSVRTWADPTGRSYQDTSRWGVGQLVAETGDDDGEPGEPGDPGGPGDPGEPGDGGDGEGDDGTEDEDGAEDDDVPPVAQVELSAEQVRPGDTLVITGTGFTSGASVDGIITSDPIDLGTQIATADGQVVFTVEIPADIALGQHTVTLTSSDGVEAAATFEVIAAEGAEEEGAVGELPEAGVGGLLALGVLAMAALAFGVVLRTRVTA